MKSDVRPFTLPRRGRGHRRLACAARARAMAGRGARLRWRYGTSLAFMRELVDDWQHELRLAQGKPRSTRCRSTSRRSTASTSTSSTCLPQARARCRCCFRMAGPGRSSNSSKSFPCSPTTSRSSCRRCPGIRFPSSRAERCALPDIGAMFDELMTRLGYSRYGAQGGDWGSFITAWLGAIGRSISPAST